MLVLAIQDVETRLQECGAQEGKRLFDGLHFSKLN